MPLVMLGAAAVASRPAPVAAIRRAFSNWSAKSGTITSGTPAANAARAVPEPPWQTTRSTWPSTLAWSIQGSTWTLAGTGPSVDASKRRPTVSSTRALVCATAWSAIR